MNKNLICLKNICKTYHNGAIHYEALKHINLTINSGEYISILGPSGSGKSTLMQIIGCLSTPSSGKYILSGQDISELSKNNMANIRNKKIGFVFQNFNLLPQNNLIDNVALPLLYRGTNSRNRKQQAIKLLEQLGLGKHIKHRPGELSGGQKQRAAIARALISEPDIILADEPTGNLDSKSGTNIITLFEELAKQGKTIILVTHDLQLAKRTKRIIQICDGVII